LSTDDQEHAVGTGGGGRTILCLASYYKGNEFIRECKRQGFKVVLLTLESLLGKPWARDHLDEVFAMPALTDRKGVVNAVSYLARTRDIARIAPLDDYDVETAALLREHLRIPGMGETTARYFRDKLAMRARARDRGIHVPEFVHVCNHAEIRRFLRDVPPPWLLKPRSEASSVGIKRFEREEDVWPVIDQMGDTQSNHLIERMIPGDVFHVDSVISDRKVVFAEVHGYRRPLLQIWQGGGIFATRTLPRGGELERQILEMHGRVIGELGLVRGASHTEYIRAASDGQIHFLETSARVGGVYISDLVEASSGVNLWREWAKLELSQGETAYALPERRRSDYGGLIVSLARQEVPDTTAYNDPEIVWRMTENPHHVGLIVRSTSPERIEELLEKYEARFSTDFLASMPPPATPAA
jgi:hypothetical protein